MKLFKKRLLFCDSNRFTQILFSAMTVIIFGLLVLSVLRSVLDIEEVIDKDPSVCTVNQCSIRCANVYGTSEIENEVINSLSEIAYGCQVTLILEKTYFDYGEIPSNFLSRARRMIHYFIIRYGKFNTIHEKAFANSIFNSTYSFILNNVYFQSNTDISFIGMKSLKFLKIVNSKNTFNTMLFNNVGQTLTHLQISNRFDWKPQVILGGSILTALQVADFHGNNFSDRLNNQSFVSLFNVRVLNLSSCSINFIGEGTFDYLLKIVFINLSDNKLVSLSMNIFDSVINFSPLLRLNLNSNPWNCNCELDFLRQYMIDGFILLEPICKSPDVLKDRVFSEIETFCLAPIAVENVNHNSTISDYFIHQNKGILANITNEITSITNGEDLPHICDLPQNYTSRRNILHIRNKTTNNLSFIHIYESPINNVTVKVETEDDAFLIWYAEKKVFASLSVLPNIGCLFVDQYALKNVELLRNELYTFCLVKSNKFIETVALFCIPYKIGEENNNMVWLTTNQKLSIVILFIVALVACLVTGAVLVFSLIRKYPKLLRGSKRVIIVKHRTTDALIMPSNNFSGIKSGKNSVPFERSNLRNSSSSYQSTKSDTPSYISIMQPSEEQLHNWRLMYYEINNSNMANLQTDQKIDEILTPTKLVLSQDTKFVNLF